MGRVAHVCGRKGEKYPDGKKVAAAMASLLMWYPNEVAKDWKVAMSPLQAGLGTPTTKP